MLVKFTQVSLITFMYMHYVHKISLCSWYFPPLTEEVVLGQSGDLLLEVLGAQAAQLLLLHHTRVATGLPTTLGVGGGGGGGGSGRSICSLDYSTGV